MKATHWLAMGAIVALVALIASFRLRDTPAGIDKIGASMSPGRIVISDNRVINLHASEEPERVRVCAKFEVDAVAVRLVVDGVVMQLEPRECRDYSARLITATPAAPLAAKQHVVLSYLILD